MCSGNQLRHKATKVRKIMQQFQPRQVLHMTWCLQGEMRVRPLLQCLQLACSSLCSFSFGSEFRKKLPPHPTMHSHCKGMHVTIGSCSPSTSCLAHRPAMAWNKNVDGGKVMARHNDKVCSTHHDKAVSCSSTKAWLHGCKGKKTALS